MIQQDALRLKALHHPDGRREVVLPAVIGKDEHVAPIGIFCAVREVQASHEGYGLYRTVPVRAFYMVENGLTVLFAHCRPVRDPREVAQVSRAEDHFHALRRRLREHGVPSLHQVDCEAAKLHRLARHRHVEVPDRDAISL